MIYRFGSAKLFLSFMIAQKDKIRIAFAGIILLTILAVVLDFHPMLEKSGLTLPNFLKPDFKLGLDLQGGTQLIYEADMSNIPEADQASSIEGVRDVIDRRVNAFGVAEPVIQATQSAGTYRIIAELAGISDVNQAIKMIGETPLLEFKIVNPNPTINLTDEQKQQLSSYNSAIETKAQDLLTKTLESGADFAALARENSDDASKVNGGDLGFIARGILVPEFEKACFDGIKDGEIYKQLVKTQFGFHIIKRIEEKDVDGTKQVRCSHILLKTKNEMDFASPDSQWLYTGLTGKQLKKAALTFDQNTQSPQVSIEFNDEGKELFGEITKTNVGKPVAIFLDGEAISVPTVQEPILDGQAVINGKFTVNEAKLLAIRLNTGALPVPINLVSQKTVGASLGNESVDQSVKAALISMLLISLFMILYYRFPGIIASLALIFYSLVLLGLFKIFNITLTLSGIAGFILSLGMAVDANILIFERIKEEVRWGKPLNLAVQDGFKRAWSSIFDGHISTLISSAILISFTTSMVKGFAIALSLGTIMSLFTAVSVTRVILVITIDKFKFLNHLWLFNIKKSQVKS